jgi:hypothetical protein
MNGVAMRMTRVRTPTAGLLAAALASALGITSSAAGGMQSGATPQVPPAAISEPALAKGRVLSGESDNVDPTNDPVRAQRLFPSLPALEAQAHVPPATAPAQPGAGLVITATFDSSITTNSNAAAIQAMINQAIAIYQSLFSDPITINLLFRYSTTDADGSALGSGTLVTRSAVVYTVTWNSVISALNNDAKTGNDRTAYNYLPASTLSPSIVLSSANGRAIGLNTPPAVFADGHVATGGPYDAIVTLNSSKPLQFTRPTSTTSYDALRVTEHEMDEILGLVSFLDGSGSNLRPEDLFTYSSSGVRSQSTSGTRYLSIDNGQTSIVKLNQDVSGDQGDWDSPSCPQPNPYVQNAFICTGQSSDVSSTSPEGISLDVIGYDLVSSASSAPGTPTNVTVSSTGSTVTITWNAPTTGGTPTSYYIEAGSSPGLEDLANFNTGSTATSFSTGGVPNGRYYVRIRASNAAGTSPASSETTLNVGNTGCTAPAQPANLTGSVSGATVTLSWSAGAGATSYILQAGSSPGSSNLVSASDVGNGTSFVANGVSNGLYYVRVLAKNSCGQSAASNEVTASVGPSSPTLQFNPAAQLSATKGQFFTTSFAAAATGGHPPYHFQLDTLGGFPPIGLVLAPSGVLSGTPSTTGSASFRVCAVDLDGTSVCKPVIVTVNDCGTTLSAAGASVPATASSGSVTVTVPTGCTWAAASGSSFITLTGFTNGSGTGSVSYSVSANTGASRVGTIRINDQTFTITQAAATQQPTTAQGSMSCTRAFNGVIYTMACTGTLSGTIGSGFTAGTSYVAFIGDNVIPSSSFVAGVPGSSYSVTTKGQAIGVSGPPACPVYTQVEIAFWPLQLGVVGSPRAALAVATIPVTCSGP